MNDLSPGSYSSMTKIEFNSLDRVLVNPLGIYGSKSEIVKFLRDIGSIDDHLYVDLSFFGSDSYLGL